MTHEVALEADGDLGGAHQRSEQWLTSSAKPFRFSKSGDLESARAEVARARDAVPAFFESYRVGAFIESSSQPEEARRLYAEAYRLASKQDRPKVAYWLAGHLLNHMAAHEAEPYAREAHDALDTPATALGLARVCMYEGQRFDEARELLDFAAEADSARTRVIAGTLSLNLAKRSVETLARDRLPVAALDAALDGIRRATTLIEFGIVDARLERELATLAAEALLVPLRVPDLSVVATQLSQLLEGIDKGFTILSRPGLRDGWSARVTRLGLRDDCPTEIAAYINKLDVRLGRRSDPGRAARESGEVVNYSGQKKYGFIRPLEGDENCFFHRTAVSDPQDLILLERGTPVTYSTRKVMHEGKPRPRAEEVTVILGEEAREAALARRRVRVVRLDDSYVMAEDVPTEERVSVPSAAFANRGEAEAGQGGRPRCPRR